MIPAQMSSAKANRIFYVVSIIAIILGIVVLAILIFDRPFVNTVIARFSQDVRKITIPNRGKHEGIWVVGQEYTLNLKSSKPYTYIFLNKEGNFLTFSYTDPNGKAQQTRIADDGFIVEVVKGTTRDQLDAVNAKYEAAIQFEYTYALPGYYAIKIPETKNIIDIMNAYSKEDIIAKVEADNAVSLAD
jgi:hypothetical protein